MHKVPYYKNKPRKRNKDGTWRKKRSDAGRKREKTMKDLDRQIELFMEASALSLVDADNPNEVDTLKKVNMELAPIMHLEAQTYLMTKMLETLDNINEKLAMMNINIQDVEQAILTKEPKEQE